MSDKPTHKMVNGVLVELTDEEIAEFERMSAEHKAQREKDESVEPKQEKPDARSRPRR